MPRKTHHRLKKEKRFGVAVIDRDYNVVTINDVVAKMLKKTPAQLVGRKCFEVFREAQAACPNCAGARAMATGKLEVAETDKISADGNVVPVRSQVFPSYGEAGEVCGFVEIMDEITERERADVHVKSLARFPSENPNPVMRISEGGTVLYANRAARLVLEAQGAEIGQTAPAEWRRLTARALGSGENTVFEVTHEERLFSFHIVPVVEAGYANWYGRDITEARRAHRETNAAQQALIELHRLETQRAEAKLAEAREELVRGARLAAVGQVSASIAHDLRNPLGAVRNASYYLKRRLAGAPPEIIEYLEIIDQEVAAADRIIGNLLGVARTKDPVKQEVDLARMVEEVLGAAGWGGKIRCRMHLAPEPFSLRADPDQLRQVIGNLLSNAARAMGGRGEIVIEARRDDGNDRIVFRDSGPGVAPEVAEWLFEPLVTTHPVGTGLGLTICRQILERHGGGIALVDRDRKGASFEIRLPRR